MHTYRGLLILLLVYFLTGCQLNTKPEYRYPDSTKIQVTLSYEVLNKKLSINEINERQKELANYINYLHQYYIAVDLLYQRDQQYIKNNDLPQFKYAQCKVVQDLFRTVDLPPPPKRKIGMSNEEAVSVLFDHIEALRQGIRSNNQRMKELKNLYRHCLQ